MLFDFRGFSCLHFSKDHDIRIPQIHYFSGMCTYLHVTYDRNFPRVSDPDAEPDSSEPMADYGGSQDAPERQLTRSLMKMRIPWLKVF